MQVILLLPAAKNKNKIHQLLVIVHSVLILLCLLLVVLPSSVTTFTVAAPTTTVERRRCVLLPWTGAAINNNRDRHNHEDASTSSSATPIGWALEERSDEGGWKVTVSLSSDEEEDSETITVHLPWKEEMQQDDRTSSGTSAAATTITTTTTTENDLAHSLWPGGIAGAIVARHLLSSNKPKQSSTSSNQERRILELGSGLGLMGWVAGATSNTNTPTTVELTDHDASAVELLWRTIPRNERQPSCSSPRYRARYLEWRDQHDVDKANKFDIILASDVAYYFYLLRPLMDTINAFLKDDVSPCDNDNNRGNVLIVGQSNRQSQWDLYDNIVHGCYNQLTDEHEAPWPGRTRMLLYRLQMSEWTTVTTSTPNNHDSEDKHDPPQDSIIPLAVLLHERNHPSSIDDNNDDGQDEFLRESDYVATRQDQEEMLISF